MDIKFIGTLYVELNGVLAWKWKSERVVMFQLVILQRSQGVNNSKHIHVRILLRLDFWNLGEFNKCVKDTFNIATLYLGKSRGIQIEEQRHQNFLNLVLKGKSRKVIRFACAK